MKFRTEIAEGRIPWQFRCLEILSRFRRRIASGGLRHVSTVNDMTVETSVTILVADDGSRDSSSAGDGSRHW